MLRAAVVIDYQNVHLTAKDVYNPRGMEYDSLISPMAFARTAVRIRNDRQRPGFPLVDLARVRVFRGLHHVDYDWEQNRRCVDQARRWRLDGALVELRDLKYDFELGANRRPVLDVNGRKIPRGRPREKGIDVLCALACVREAARPDIDVVILASRDTDLVPALDEVYDLHGEDRSTYGGIETVAWYNPRAREENTFAGGNLRPSGNRRIWNTNLDRAAYEASLDRRNYR